MRLYVASSWRNPYQQDIVGQLREQGHEVYDFRKPPGGSHLGFSWAEIDPDWQAWDVNEYVAALGDPIANAGFTSDFGAMQDADAGVLVLPCGRSAHLEAGYFVGAGKPLWVLLDPREYRIGDESGVGVAAIELMYLMADGIFRDRESLFAAIGHDAAIARSLSDDVDSASTEELAAAGAIYDRLVAGG